MPSALHCFLSRGVAGNGCVFVWNITGLQELCRNLAMQFKLLMYKRQDGELFTVGWRQRRGLNYFQKMCKFQVIVLWDVMPYSVIIHQSFRLILCPQRQEGGEKRGCKINIWIMVTPYASVRSINCYLRNWQFFFLQTLTSSFKTKICGVSLVLFL